MEAIPADDLRTIITAARTRGGKLATLVEILSATGCRRREALGLQWADVDQDRRNPSHPTQLDAIGESRRARRRMPEPARLLRPLPSCPLCPGAPDSLVVGYGPNAADKHGA